ncbi:MAG: peptidoglycan-binding domain-containing protein [Spartobacteria bacterium]
MKRIFSLVLVLCAISVVSSVRADDAVRSLQNRLREGGFYFGDPSGVYDEETSAAVTRYQIRNGLPITGKLDVATGEKLGVAAAKPDAAQPPPSASGTWHRLRNGDLQFVDQATASGNNAPAPATPTPAEAARAKPAPVTAPSGPSPTENVAQAGPRREAPSAPATRPAGPGRGGVYGDERLRDYIGAFVLAGLDPQVSAELEFFAERVDYFGERNVARDRIRRDLVRYDRKWPERKFWLAGELQVRQLPGERLEVTFPLRYDLRGHSEHASGQVMKTLTLRKRGQGDLEIVAMNERKA